MGRRRYDDKMKLDMSFSEALRRFAGVKPEEMHANIKRAKKRKPPGGKKAKPGGPKPKNVVSLRDQRMKRGR